MIPTDKKAPTVAITAYGACIPLDIAVSLRQRKGCLHQRCVTDGCLLTCLNSIAVSHTLGISCCGCMAHTLPLSQALTLVMSCAGVEIAVATTLVNGNAGAALIKVCAFTLAYWPLQTALSVY